jgi:OOP family OmpA-OmpF porin
VKLTLGTKVVIAFVGALLLYFVGTQLNIVPSRFVQRSLVPVKSGDLPSDTIESKSVGVTPTTLPGTRPSTTVRSAAIRMNVIPWNAEMGLAFANGGPVTTSDSLMEKHGVRLTIDRQNDQNVTRDAQATFATALASSSNPTTGVHFAVIMGDGAAQYLVDLTKLTSKLGPDYRPEVIGAAGFSYGEDAFMGPEEWKTNPQSMKGGLTAGVLRDGDWNISLYYLLQNAVPNNPDERTYDPDAMNWVSVDEFTKAGELYISDYCEDRDVVRNGRKTGQKAHEITNDPRGICVRGAVTWTPGDVTIAKKKGGLIKILSTKENSNQMPAAIIGIHKWDVANAKLVTNLLAATFEGADQVRTSDAALKRASVAMFAIMKEESPSYWLKYYKGSVEQDKAGLTISLGGSRVANLGDNLKLFGLAENSGGPSGSAFASSYNIFGKIAKQQYPQLVPSFPPVEQAVNTTMLAELERSSTNTAPSETESFSPGPIEKENVVAKKNYNIQFETGKASFTPAALETLNDLYNVLNVGSLAVQIDGHTDNVGDAKKNQALSEERAFAVKSWLEAKAPALFQQNRISARGYGQEMPVAPNSTPDGRATNRRVTITIGTK